MSLVQRVSELKDNVVQLKNAQAGFNEAKLLQSRLVEITDTSDSLSEQVERLRLFRKNGIELLEIPSGIIEVNKRLTKIQERFKKECKAKNLTKGKDWEIMQSTVREIENTIKQDLLKSWKAYVSNAYSGETPHDLRKMLAPIDSNKSAFSRYKQSYDELNSLLKNIPDDNQGFEDVNIIATQLKAIYSDFDFNVPDVVKDFLTAVGEGGASLELLSDEVRNWLSENNTYNRYTIVAKR